MHPAPSLAEAPPHESDEPRLVHHLSASPEHLDHGASPPVRKDTTSTTSSTSTTATAASSATLVSSETAPTSYSAESSPTFAAQAVFSARDGSDVISQRRPSRRRTGPLTAVQRERAHLIRKMGACPDCRRRRVACHPNHHNMTWEEAARKFNSRSHHKSSSHELAPIAGPRLSPAPLSSKAAFTPDSQEMDLDTSPSHHPPIQPTLSETRISRTPLPSGPRPEKPASMLPLPGLDSFRTDLQGSADRILANPFRSRYAHVAVLLVQWQDDDDLAAQSAVQDLAKVFAEDYRYAVQIKSIPASHDGSGNPWLWLSSVVTDYMNHNHRDILKIFYYSGYSYLDGDRDTVLASSKRADPASVIRWSGIQQIFENARSDALLIMDCAYYPSYKTIRRQGMLEVVAASAGEDHVELLGRSAFTLALADLLRRRVAQPFKEPFSAAELHSQLLALYPRIIREQNPEKEVVARFPTPLSMQLSGAKTLPSILLAPLPRNREPPPPRSPPGGGGGPSSLASSSHICLTFRLADDAFNMDSWAEWLRCMPEGITDVRVDSIGPYRNTF